MSLSNVALEPGRSASAYPMSLSILGRLSYRGHGHWIRALQACIGAESMDKKLEASESCLGLLAKLS